jgi:hypothetical protein
MHLQRFDYVYSHVQTEIIQNQKEGLPNSPQDGKKYLDLESVNIFRVCRVTGNKHIHVFFFGLIERNVF